MKRGEVNVTACVEVSRQPHSMAVLNPRKIPRRVRWR